MVRRRRSDADLLRGARGGDEEAWSALVDRYARLVYAIPLRIGLPPDSSVNIFHTVFRRLLENLDEVRDSDALMSWLVQATTSEARRLRGGVAMSPRVDALSSIAEKPLGEDTIHNWMRQQIVREATQQLSERCQRLLDAVLYSETPPSSPELAHRLNLPEPRVSAERARCFEALLEILEAWDFE